jgi:hypothetical protein
MYEYVDEESFLNITNYFYGESDRWLKLWNMRMKQVSLTEGLGSILKLGFRGTYIHFRGLSRIAVNALSRQRNCLWRKTRKAFAEYIG